MSYSKIAVKATLVAVSQMMSPVEAWELELKLAQKADKGWIFSLTINNATTAFDKAPTG